MRASGSRLNEGARTPAGNAARHPSVLADDQNNTPTDHLEVGENADSQPRDKHAEQDEARGEDEPLRDAENPFGLARFCSHGRFRHNPTGCIGR